MVEEEAGERNQVVPLSDGQVQLEELDHLVLRRFAPYVRNRCVFGPHVCVGTCCQRIFSARALASHKCMHFLVMMIRCNLWDRQV